MCVVCVCMYFISTKFCWSHPWNYNCKKIDYRLYSFSVCVSVSVCECGSPLCVWCTSSPALFSCLSLWQLVTKLSHYWSNRSLTQHRCVQTHTAHTLSRKFILSCSNTHALLHTHTHILTLSAEEEKTIASPFLCYTDIFDSTHTHIYSYNINA